MAECVFVDIPQRTEEWHRFRAAGPPENPFSVAVGASEIPAIMGEDRYQTLAGLRDEKLGVKVRKVNAAMSRGTASENMIAEKYVRETGNFGGPILCFNPETPWLFASLDWMSGNVVAEFKRHEREDDREVIASGLVPRHNYGQAQAQIHCSGCAVHHFVSLGADDKITIITTPRDDQYIERMIAASREFCAGFPHKGITPLVMAAISTAGEADVDPAHFRKAMNMRDELLNHLRKMEVTTANEAESSEALSKLTTLLNDVESARKEAGEPYLRAKQRIDAAAKVFSEPLLVEKARLSKELGRLAANREEKKQQLEDEARIKALDVMASGASIDVAKAEAAAIVASAPESEAEDTAAVTRPVFTIINEDIVHRDLCSPDEKKIREWIKSVWKAAKSNRKKFFLMLEGSKWVRGLDIQVETRARKK